MTLYPYLVLIHHCLAQILVSLHHHGLFTIPTYTILDFVQLNNLTLDKGSSMHFQLLRSLETSGSTEVIRFSLERSVEEVTIIGATIYYQVIRLEFFPMGCETPLIALVMMTSGDV